MSGNCRVDLDSVPQMPVAGTIGKAALHAITFKLSPLGSGAADSVSIYPVGTLPMARFRVVAVEANIDSAKGGASVALNTHSDGSGDDLGTVSGAATGKPVAVLPIVQPDITSGAAQGLFARRSDNRVGGWITVYVVPLN